MIVAPMAANAQEPVGSMGTDTPLAVLSGRPKLLFAYFKQLFAQVTNPPIDPLREGLVMSLMSFTGKQQSLLDETPKHCRQLKLSHPILTDADMDRLRSVNRDDFKVATLPALFDADESGSADALRRALGRPGRSGRGRNSGRSVVVGPDRPGHFGPKSADTKPVGHRRRASRLAGTPAAERGRHRGGKRRAARGDALLPVVWLRRQCRSIRTWPSRRSTNCTTTATCPADVELDQLYDHFVTAVKKGILKTMSKMGISTLRSYRIRHSSSRPIGLNSERSIDKLTFAGTASRIEGAGLDD